MDSKNQLYLLTTRGLGEYYVVGTNPTEAEDFLNKIFTDQDYGFSKDRKVINIKWLAESPNKHGDKPFLSDKDKKLFITSE